MVIERTTNWLIRSTWHFCKRYLCYKKFMWLSTKLTLNQKIYSSIWCPIIKSKMWSLSIVSFQFEKLLHLTWIVSWKYSCYKIQSFEQEFEEQFMILDFFYFDLFNSINDYYNSSRKLLDKNKTLLVVSIIDSQASKFFIKHPIST